MINDIANVLELAGIAYLIFLGHGIPAATLAGLSSIFAPKQTVTVAPVVTTHTDTTTAA